MKIKNDPLEVLVHGEDWLKGYKEGYRKGQDDMQTEISEEDFPVLEKRAFDRGAKYLKNTMKIINQWNLREISGDQAIEKINKYLRLKVKL